MGWLAYMGPDIPFGLGWPWWLKLALTLGALAVLAPIVMRIHRAAARRERLPRQ
ncbi:MAG: hypothetical protein AB1486_04245 [Planctomycetota bacterium]